MASISTSLSLVTCTNEFKAALTAASPRCFQFKHQIDPLADVLTFSGLSVDPNEPLRVALHPFRKSSITQSHSMLCFAKVKIIRNSGK
jgi:hypothetical protein